MVVEVLEPKWHKFQANVLKVQTIDEILLLHNNFLDECLKECLLTDQNLLKILVKIHQACIFFSRIIAKFNQTIKVEDEFVNARELAAAESTGMSDLEKRRQRIQGESRATKKIIVEKSYQRMMEKFSKTFDDHLKEFMNFIRSSRYEPHIANLFTRLDFNNYYSNHLLTPQGNAGTFE